MPASIGVNLRVTGHCKQGGRKYMEDYLSVAYQQTEDEKDLEYAFFGIFDGHGGSEAATFAKEHLMEFIVRQRQFWSEKDEDVLKAIREGFIATHLAMWKEQDKWPRTASGLPSTAGTTASVAFIRRGRIFTGHVGDSGIILGYKPNGTSAWEARRLTKDHKPESRAELARIEQSGGKVVSKSGVPRVVWYRPQIGHKGPITRSTPFDEIPFLAVARSLGDLWSYNSANNEFVVSPEPDTNVIPIDTDTFRCLIFGTDGLWNMISPAAAVGIVQAAEQHNAMIVLSDNPRAKSWINPSMNLVERALDRWSSTRLRADNTSVVTLMLDPPGPPRAQVIRNAQRLLSEQQRQQQQSPQHQTQTEQQQQHQNGQRDIDFYPDQQQKHVEQAVIDEPAARAVLPDHQYPATGLHILTRYEGAPSAPVIERPSAPARYTEEYLDKLHMQLYGSLFGEPAPADSTYSTIEQNHSSSLPSPPPLLLSDTISDKPSCSSSCPSPDSPVSCETIQINVVSSSSDGGRTVTNNEPLLKKSTNRSRKSREVESLVSVGRVSMPCTRSHSSKSVICTRARSITAKLQNSGDNHSPSKSTRALSSKHRSRSMGPVSGEASHGIRTHVTPNNRAPITMMSERTRSCKSTIDCNSKSKSYGHTPKREQSESSKEITTGYPSQLMRSRSLGPTDFPHNRICQTTIALTPSTTKSRSRPQRLEQTEDRDEEVIELNALRFMRSKSLGPLDLPYNTVRQTTVTAISSKGKLRARPPKRERSTGGEEENSISSVPQFKRSRSLGPRDFPDARVHQTSISTTTSRTKSRGRPPKREQPEDSDEKVIELDGLEFMRSRSLGPHELSCNVHSQTMMTANLSKGKLRGRPPKRERVAASEEENSKSTMPEFKRSRSLGPRDLPDNGMTVITIPPRPKSRGRPQKRERSTGGDEENALLSAPQHKRSRSLGPSDLRRRDIAERNLRERNTLTDTQAKLSPPVTRSHKSRKTPN